jgi:hypothetical protein
VAEIDILDLNNDWVSIKFPQSVSTAYLTNEHFRLYLNVSTPVEIVDPFNPINVISDYESISRVLTLHFKVQLNPDTPYLLTATGLNDPADRALLDEEYYFTSTHSPQPSPLVPIPEPTYVQDMSLVPDIFSSDESFVVIPGSGFGLLSYDPNDQFIDVDTNNGRFDLVFSEVLDDLPPKTIRVQRKLLSINVTRWEYINAQITVNGPEVYVDFPSIDATPVYFTNGTTYFEEGYKYRIKLSHNIKSVSGATLGDDKTITFMVGADPLFAETDQIAVFFPDADIIEITELIYGFSQEAIQITGLTSPTPLMQEYVTAATLCALSRIYDDLGLADQEDFQLGDLHITQRRQPKNRIPTRATATSWCELAGILRLELTSFKSPMKTYVKGANVIIPMPSRQLKHQEWRSWDGD